MTNNGTGGGRGLPGHVARGLALFAWGVLLSAAGGCQSSGTQVITTDNGKLGTIMVQASEVTLRPGESNLVHYAVPYAAPPNLVILEPEGSIRGYLNFVEQKGDCFKIKYDMANGTPITVKWRAEGMPASHPKQGEEESAPK